MFQSVEETNEKELGIPAVVSEAILRIVATGEKLTVDGFAMFMGRYSPAAADDTDPVTGAPIKREEKVLLWAKIDRALNDVVNGRRELPERYVSRELEVALTELLEEERAGSLTVPVAEAIDTFFRAPIETLLSDDSQSAEVGRLGKLVVRDKAPIKNDAGQTVIAGKRVLTLVPPTALKAELLERWSRHPDH